MHLLPFLWRYFRRYTLWAIAGLVAVILFAVSTAAMISLAEPIFGDVLQAGSGGSVEAQELDLPGLPSIDSEGDGWLGRLNPRRRLAELYDAIKSRVPLGERGEIFFAPLLFIVVFVVRAASSFASGYSFQRIGLGATNDMRNDLYRHVIYQSAKFHGRHTSGELISRIVNDVAKLQSAISSRMFDLFQQSAALVALLAMLLATHLQLALLCLVATPAFVYFIARFGYWMRRFSHRSQERMADLSALLTEGIRGNRVVKAFGMEDFECERFDRATEQHLRVNLRAQVVSNISSPVLESLSAIGGAALVIYAGHLIREGRLDAPLLIQFLFNLFMLYDPIRKLNRVNLVVQEAVAVTDRVQSLLATPNEIEDRPTSPPLKTVSEGIRFVDVDFAYDRQPVLEGFSLDVPRGQVVALVGRSGAGKSTVVNLVPRFFDPDRGRVEIDGIDIRDLPLQNLRSLIGIVTQETILFNDTVRNNIAYGHTDVPLERVREAAAAAYADEFVMQLDNGYDTVVGESGMQLSGGQRQRLAIARALLKNAPILILDEATSHLDTESEVLVQRAISNLMEGRTSLVIAHRLSTVIRADRIVVMDSGSIVEQGTHQELLALDGAYKRLYDLQFKE